MKNLQKSTVWGRSASDIRRARCACIIIIVFSVLCTIMKKTCRIYRKIYRSYMCSYRAYRTTHAICGIRIDLADIMQLIVCNLVNLSFSRKLHSRWINDYRFRAQSRPVAARDLSYNNITTLMCDDCAFHPCVYLGCVRVDVLCAIWGSKYIASILLYAYVSYKVYIIWH